jgi:glycosyltransferase involved in cell wall biosynthesis
VKVAILFDNLGPYHHARLAAAAKVCELTAIEVDQRSTDYAWSRQQEPLSFPLQPLWDQTDAATRTGGGHARAVNAALQRILPDAVLLPGWSSVVALVALRWCLRQGTPAVVMSESTDRDELRLGWKEWVKQRIVRLFSSALVGGRPQGDYLVQLGMPQERICLGYDAVDNRYFADKAGESRKQKAESRKAHGLPESYFLASARFVEKKNLARLLEAYARYRKEAESRKQKAETWGLVLLGDGPLRADLWRLISDLSLHDSVVLPGFKQYPDLPAYYGLAGAFIHASTAEQWGLVVNEAMASGLPVLVSNRCGCASDLVQEGVNGFTFDPYNVEELARLMLKLSTLNSQLSTMGDASRRIIADWGPERFASGLQQAVETALRMPRPRSTWIDRLLLTALAHR